MEIASEVRKTLQADKKNRIIERYLREKYKATFQADWLNTPANYLQLGNAIDFLYNLDDDNLALTAVGSDNEVTRETYKGHFDKLVILLDKFVPFSDTVPPIAQAFNEKEAMLESIKIKQGFAARSLRDLHAQNSNLGIAEKLLNGTLTPSEWLSEVDLDRTLIKLGVKDKVHVTRLNAEDIGMILHFEREKHGADPAPYSIPLMINCGSGGTSQGSHWTEALVRVNPATNTITVDYRDSMPLNPGVRDILTTAIHYDATSNVNGVIRQYTAFPAVVEPELTINVGSDNSQVDSWSCGYRALHNLLRHANFPAPLLATPQWTAFTNADYASSGALRNAIYQTLLDNLQIDEQFFANMQLGKEAFKHLEASKGYKLDKDFAESYLKFLTDKPTKPIITSEQFAKEYKTIASEFSKINFETDRKEALKQLQEKVAQVTNGSLSSDAKIFALLDVLAGEYNTIVQSRWGSGSKLAKSISKFCDEQLGVTLSKGPNYHFKKDGLLLRMITQLGKKPGAEEVVLPLPKSSPTEPKKISISAPVIGSLKMEPPKISPSVNIIHPKADPGQLKLLASQNLSRIGTMFGDTQFCYGGKPGGVEPGFRAIDLDETFFEALKKIVPPETATGKEVDAYKILLETISKAETLKQKQAAFATFINVTVPRPHAPETISPTISWLCEQIKEAVKGNEDLSAWMYKLDYAERGAAKERTKANKEALREFVGTRLAGIFSDKNQRQEIAWVKGPSGPHALLACGWKNGLKELSEFLHAGGEPDYNGVLVDDPKAPVKRAKQVPGLGANLIFGIAIGDRDGIGKDAQNKGFAGNAFYGFDYGKPYEGDGVCASLREDFTFVNPGAGAPEVFRGSGPLGLARHIMYRNYSVFYDTDLSERMMGVHFLKKMITGENPSEEVIQSYPPEFRRELYRIQQQTPSPESLLNRLSEIRDQCKEGSLAQGLIDNLSMQISAGKLRTFDLYFAQIKIDLIEAALETGMAPEELTDHLKLLDKWAAKAAESNQQILKVFEQRLLLPKDEINFLDKLEKIFSPTEAMSYDGGAFLNHMRIRTPLERIPFQLTKESDGSYTLTTTNKTIREELKKQLGLNFNITVSGLSCSLSSSAFAKLMADVNEKYETKRDGLLAEPTLRLVTLPNLKSTYTSETLPRLGTVLSHETPELKGVIELLWRPDTTLSLRLTAKTEEQVKLIQGIFGLAIPPTINKPVIIEIPPAELQQRQEAINKAYQQAQGIITEHPTAEKWAKLHKDSRLGKEEAPEEVSEAQLLINRFEDFKTIDPTVLGLLKTAIGEMSHLDISELLSKKDDTLKDKKNIQHIINDEIDQVVDIDMAQEIELQTIGKPNTQTNFTL